jgi:hypothetical protein
VSLVVQTALGAGSTCQYGGTEIQSGLDTNGDGLLGAGEVTSVTYLCNGAPGTPGSQVQVTNEPPGSNCPAGGERIDIGTVADGGFVAQQTAYVCNGAAADASTSPSADPDSVYVSTTDAQAADDTTCGLGPVGSGDGNHPCMTIARGIARAGALARSQVRVANGTYAEALTLVNGINLLGGFDPQTWSRDIATTSTLLTGVSSSDNHDRTVVANAITTPTTLEGFVVYGSVNQKAGGNSYAIYASGSNDGLQIVNNLVYGGAGGPGADGSPGIAGHTGVDGAGRNTSASDPSYDAIVATGTGECNTSNNRQHLNGGILTCGATTVSGGNGGGNRCPVMSYCDNNSSGCQTFHWTKYTAIAGANGAAGGTSGGAAGGGGPSGDDQIQIYATNQGYVCYPPPDATNGVNGTNGNNAPPVGAVAGCSTPSGSVVSGDWVGGSGLAGPAGHHGGGGGGGGAGGGSKCEDDGLGHTVCVDGTGTDSLGAHGGGGGSGGCGGQGGSAGGPGGGAFDVFIVGTGTAAPVITNNRLLRGTGGRGGAGGAGGAGGTAGLGAPGGTVGVPSVFCTDAAGRGGNGGNGGHGSGAGGGCGGASYAVYTSGIGSPSYCQASSNNTIGGGGAGSGGPGGQSLGNPGGAGTDGVLVACSFN